MELINEINELWKKKDELKGKGKRQDNKTFWGRNDSWMNDCKFINISDISNWKQWRMG